MQGQQGGQRRTHQHAHDKFELVHSLFVMVERHDAFAVRWVEDQIGALQLRLAHGGQPADPPDNRRQPRDGDDDVKAREEPSLGRRHRHIAVADGGGRDHAVVECRAKVQTWDADSKDAGAPELHESK
eukprot:scaffold356_cov69-Phaeocystis_antarctica.AAC.4